MKRVLFDENLPRLLRRRLADFEIRTVQEEGWGSFRNGELLRRAEGNFDVLLTADRGMQYQQNLTTFSIGVVVIVTPRLQLQLLERAAEQLANAIERVAPGQLLHVNVER
ncbi:MAG: DUF5615 family PIN-like protein [Acidobacteriota bacterium]|nr:DUF5615 family PIN-like protein [Acidobacteriota bacterium]